MESSITNRVEYQILQGSRYKHQQEFKEYFRQKKFVTFEHVGEQSDNAIDKVFNKKRADDKGRIGWVITTKMHFWIQTRKVSYDDFIDREMIHFSKYDNDRSIPNVMDGLKNEFAQDSVAAFEKPYEGN